METYPDVLRGLANMLDNPYDREQLILIYTKLVDVASHYGYRIREMTPDSSKQPSPNDPE